MKRAICLAVTFALSVSLFLAPVFLAAEEDDFTEPGANFQKPLTPEEEAALGIYGQQDAETAGTGNQEHDAAVH